MPRSLYLDRGVPVYTFNFLGLERYSEKAPKAVLAGNATIRFEFAYNGGGPGKGGLGAIAVNGTKVAKGRIERMQPNVFSADETADVGVDEATPVTEDYQEGENSFTGRIDKVTVGLK
jgi:arylsulfatase